MDVGAVLDAARVAKESGASRFCMGAAWREVKDNRQFDRVLEMIRGVKGLGLEACATLGMVTEDQARRMKEATLASSSTSKMRISEWIITERLGGDRLKSALRESFSDRCTGARGLRSRVTRSRSSREGAWEGQTARRIERP